MKGKVQNLCNSKKLWFLKILGCLREQKNQGAFQKVTVRGALIIHVRSNSNMMTVGLTVPLLKHLPSARLTDQTPVDHRLEDLPPVDRFPEGLRGLLFFIFFWRVKNQIFYLVFSIIHNLLILNTSMFDKAHIFYF